MKNKLLSLLLVITLLAVTISVALPTNNIVEGKEVTGLISNGDFATYSGYTPTDWKVDIKTTEGGASAEIVKNVPIASGVTANALKVVTTKDDSNINKLTYKKKIKIEKNASYTMTYWVKVKAIKGLKTYMYEPDYINLNGVASHDDHAHEGQNIYSFRFVGDGSTRVIRTDIEHKWVVKETGTIIDAAGPSMFITRKGTTQVLTPDYPNTNREGDWLQVEHTFATGNLNEHEAEVAYEITFPSAVGGEVWLADFKMSAVKSDAAGYFTPDVNDATLGTVSKNVPLYNGKEITIKAEPFGENIFSGWYVGKECVSTDVNFTFTYNPDNQPEYKACFIKGSFGIDGSFETGFAKDQVLAKAIHTKNAGAANSEWTTTSFLSSEKSNSGVFVDSHYGGVWREASITNAFAHTGNYSLCFNGTYGQVGYKYTGLAKNTEYVLSVYAYLVADSEPTQWPGITNLIVTPANASCVSQKSDGSYAASAQNPNALVFQYLKDKYDTTSGWTKIEVKIDTKENTDVILWLESSGKNAKLYLDNFAIKRIPKAFSPAVNDANIGTVTPKGLSCAPGDEVTVTATAVNDGKFLGWYIGEELKSTNSEYTFTFADEFLGLTAKFEAGKFTIPNYSFETGYTNNQVLAESPNVSYEPNKNIENWNPELFKSSSKDGNNKFFIDSDWSTYGKVVATTEQAHTGKFSIRMSPNSRFIGYKLEGIEKNTEYTLSFYAMTKNEPDGKIGSIIVTDANQSAIVKNTNKNSLTQITLEAGALGKTSGADIDCKDTWKKFTVRFNSKESTDVILWVYGGSAKTGLKYYIDDLSLRYAPKLFKPAINNGGLGSVTPSTTLECEEGDQVTVTATPYPDVTFNGWYIGDELISTDKEYTFSFTDRYEDLTAVFEGVPGTIPNGGFEYYSDNKALGTFNPNKTPSTEVETPWSIDDQYRNLSYNFKIVKNIVHSGEKAAMLDVPYRYIGLDINGLQPNTDYMVSFWAHVTGQDPEPGKDQNEKAVNTAFVLKKGEPALIKNEKGEYVSAPANTRLGNLSTPVKCYNTWKQVNVIFKTPADTKDVTLWVSFSGYSAKLYVDDFAVRFAPDMFKPASNNSSLGAVYPQTDIPCDEGDEVTVNASPYPDSVFKGWYIGDELKSTNLEYTFNYSSEYKKLVAKFEGAPGTIPNPGFEYFEKDQVLAKYNSEAAEPYQNNAPWSVDTTYKTDKDTTIKVVNNIVHSGEKAAMLNVPYRYAGMDINGLQPNTEYMVSFWAYITGDEPVEPKDDKNPKNITAAFVLDKEQELLTLNEKGSYVTPGPNARLGEIGAQVNCYNKWEQINIIFKTTADTKDVTLWFTFSGFQAKLYVDDFSIGYGVRGSVSAELGGTINTNLTSEYVLKGANINVEAVPYEGNTFVGWFTPTGDEVSKEANYTFAANENFTLIAKFDGYNKPATDLFAIGGKDGSFENGSVPGWSFADTQYGCSWCSASVSSQLVYEGSKSLEINARYRNSILTLSGLTPNSDYRLSFYINLPDTNEKAKVDSIGVVGVEYSNLGEANTIFAQTKIVAANSGWNKIDLYFNTGANVSANLIIRFSAETLDGKSDRLFIDNLSLYNYDSASEIANGSFENGKENWIGAGSVANGAINLNANESVYQDLKVDPYSSYVVTFKAKGKITAAAQDLSKFDIGVKNYITAKSYVDVNNTALTEYSYTVYTGVHKAINLVFGAIENGAVIDDVKITKQIGTAGSILESIDFETERHSLSDESKNSGFSIYTATSANDPNVISGKNSLKFTYDKNNSADDKVLNEGWLSYMPGIGNSLKVSLKYKIVKGKDGGAISIMPEYSGTYGGDSGFEHLSKTSEWQSISFYVSNTTYATFKTKIAAIGGITESDFYIDDIVISVTPPMVLEENSTLLYCERLYNAIDNESFESAASDKDWKNLPSTAQIVKGDALKGSGFLRASAGTHYVIPVAVKPATEYYFAASVRGNANTVGSIGISLDAQGNQYYADRNEKPASSVQFDSSEKGWKRSGFKISSDNSGIAYIVIDVTAGALDIDSVMLFTGDYGYRYDPNDYTVYLPYDFDNLKSSTTVINGGFGEQPYYKEPTKRGKEGA